MLVILFRLNALFSIEITLSGIVTLTRCFRANSFCLITVTVLGMTMLFCWVLYRIMPVKMSMTAMMAATTVIFSFFFLAASRCMYSCSSALRRSCSAISFKACSSRCSCSNRS